MAKLINFGPGEMSDRLTILALKIHHVTEQGGDPKHFTRERDALLTKIRGQNLNAMWFQYVLELGAVNGALWQATDKLRALNPGTEAQYVDAGLLGLQILAWNDHRAELVEKINKETGEHRGSEKVSNGKTLDRSAIKAVDYAEDVIVGTTK